MEPKALTLVLAKTFPIFIFEIFVPSAHRVQKAAVYMVFMCRVGAEWCMRLKEEREDRGLLTGTIHQLHFWLKSETLVRPQI